MVTKIDPVEIDFKTEAQVKTDGQPMRMTHQKGATTLTVGTQVIPLTESDIQKLHSLCGLWLDDVIPNRRLEADLKVSWRLATPETVAGLYVKHSYICDNSYYQQLGDRTACALGIQAIDVAARAGNPKISNSERDVASLLGVSVNFVRGYSNALIPEDPPYRQGASHYTEEANPSEWNAGLLEGARMREALIRMDVLKA